ncbi:MAG: hypothetical protein WAM28_09175 [Chlamydiales bacterium]
MALTYLATIKKRYCLNAMHSGKETYHIELDAPFKYEVGDRIGVYPENDPRLVQQILDSFGATGNETVIDSKKNSYPFKEYLLTKANLARIPKKLFTYTKKSHLLDPSNQQILKHYLETHHLFDLISEGPQISPQILCDCLSPLLPRFYSIASSQQVVGDEIHLTVALSQNPPHFPTHYGTCSHFLCSRAQIGRPAIPIFLDRAKNFFLPSESVDKPLIMIGPGTGIAPFRGFMQQRIFQNAPDKNWLFFGERQQLTHFYYQSYWEELVKNNQLWLDCAFSRDQEEKIYVQHKMLEKSHLIWKWLEEGAYLFVCGDAANMAKDVHKTLLEILEKEGKMAPDEAKEYIKNLKKEHRYQRDVY